jgi:hypothetical protein
MFAVGDRTSRRAFSHWADEVQDCCLDLLHSLAERFPFCRQLQQGLTRQRRQARVN